MPGLCTPSIVFTFISHYWFFHHNTLNSDALLDPCFKTGYLTCKIYKSKRIVVVETASNKKPVIEAQLLVPQPELQNEPQRPIWKSALCFLVESAQLKAELYQNQSLVPPFPALFLAHLLPLIKKTTVNRRPLSSQPPNCSLDTISGTFNFVFTILFNFPSQYFSAIGLHVIFRFGRNLPPILRTIPKVRDSKAKGDPWNSRLSYRAFTFIGSNFHWNSQVFNSHQPLAQKVHRNAR